MLRADQDELLRWVLAAIDASPTTLPGASWERDRFAAAGLATGLTAAVATLAEHAGLALPPAWAGYAAEQREEVAARHARFAEAGPRVLAALASAGVGAIPVKGAVLARDVWPLPATRPMADIDLVVAPGDRGRAAAALAGAGLAVHGTSAWEDTFLLWGDGGVGRRDGESREHNGKVEVHPGWVERLHDYLVDGTAPLLAATAPGELGGAPCLRLTDAAFAAHVLGHLGACAIRGEVRAVNVVDAALVVRALDGDGVDALVRFAGALDPRAVGAGVWLAGRYAAMPPSLVDVTSARLPAAARRQLAAADPSDVLRQLGARTTISWRRSWATNRGERAAVLRQALWPAAGDLADLGGEHRRPNGDGGGDGTPAAGRLGPSAVAAAQARRAGRVAWRGVRRVVRARA